MDTRRGAVFATALPKAVCVPPLSTAPRRSPRRGARRRIRLANSRPNLRPHWRIVSCVTEMPRAASISSTMRRLNGNRKYSHTA